MDPKRLLLFRYATVTIYSPDMKNPAADHFGRGARRTPRPGTPGGVSSADSNRVLVGSLFVELDRLDLAIAEFARRMALLVEAPHINPETVERMVAGEFGDRREEVRREGEENARYEQVHAEERSRPELEGSAREDVLRISRELALRHHPNTTLTDEERARREPVMQEINEAFRERDLDRLRRILEWADDLG